MIWAICNLLLSVIEMCAIWTGTFFFMRINSRTVYVRKVWYILGFTLTALICYLDVLLFSENWISVLLQPALTAVLGILLFHRRLLPVILDVLFSVVVIIGMECGIFICNVILRYTGIGIFPNPASIGCMAMVLKLLVLLPLMYAMIRWKKAQTDGRLTLRQTITVLILPAFSLLFLYSLLEMCDVYIQLHGLWLVVVNITALLLLNIYFLYLFRYFFRASKLEQEMKLTQVQNELQYRHYEELEQKYRESRKVLHDMKNHLQAVEQLYEGENKEAGDNYVRNLYHMINILGEKYYSSNRMLNIILNEKLSQAQKLGIKVSAEVGDADFSDIQDIDITTIFANLLDNALEAAVSAADPWMELNIDIVQDFRVIRIRNSRGVKPDSPAQDSNELPLHTSLGHMGLGLDNVRQTLEKYHGSLEQTETEKEYCINIMIPGKE